MRESNIVPKKKPNEYVEIIFTPEALAAIKASGNFVGHHADSDRLVFTNPGCAEVHSGHVTIVMANAGDKGGQTAYIYPLGQVARVKMWTEACIQQLS